MFQKYPILWSATLFILLGFLQELTCAVHLRRACNDITFFRPYVEILARRGGEPLFKLERPGFVDLRNQYGVFLCINGPAFTYRDIKVVRNVSSSVFEVVEFIDPEIKVYRHECFVINRYVSREEGGAGTEEQIRLSGYVPPMNKRYIVHGYQAFGVTLTGNREDYRFPAIHMFTGPNFEDNTLSFIMGSSFVLIGSYGWRSHDKFTNTTLIIMPPPGTQKSYDNHVCYYKPNNFSSDFDKVLQRGHTRLDYKWNIVSLEDSKTPNNSLGPRYGQRKPNADPPIYFVTENISRKYAFEYPEDTDTWVTKPFSTVVAHFEDQDCKPIEPYTDLCAEVNKLSTEVEACDVVKSVLELEPRDWTKAPINDLKWKGDIINMIEQIFVKICSRLDENVAESIADVFLDHYVLAFHKAQKSLNRTEDPEWKNIMAHLTECRDKAEMLIFYSYTQEVKPWRGPYVHPDVYNAPEGNESVIVMDYDYDEERMLRYKQRSEVDDHPEWKMLPLVVRTSEGRDAAIFHFEEAVEADFRFNIVIDYQWKIFSTVAGYCSKFEKSTLKDLVGKFNVDFLSPIKTEWVKTSKNNIYTYMMVDDIALDECLEGSYLHSGNRDMRALRELEINPGYEGQTTVNHFTRVPPANYFRK